MKYLLDTHTMLWFINDDASLSAIARALIEEPENIIYLSVASIWEMAIKVSLGKLEMPSPFTAFIDEQLDKNTTTLLNITIKKSDAKRKSAGSHQLELMEESAGELAFRPLIV